MKEICNFRGDKEKWDRFTEKVKQSHISIWGVLESFIDWYLEEEKE